MGGSGLFWRWFGSASGLLVFLLSFSLNVQAENNGQIEIKTIRGEKKAGLIEREKEAGMIERDTKEEGPEGESNFVSVERNGEWDVERNEGWNGVHEDILTVQAGGSWLQDQYLSPLRYDGLNVGIANEWWQGFRGAKGDWKNSLSKGDREYSSYSLSRGGSGVSSSMESGFMGRWEHVGKVGLQVLALNNTPKTNKIYAIGINAGWGAYYTWKWPKRELLTTEKKNVFNKQEEIVEKKNIFDEQEEIVDNKNTSNETINNNSFDNKTCKRLRGSWQIGLGPYLAGDLMPRYIVSNVNKPYSMDISAEVQAMGFVSYSFGGKKTSYRLRYLVRTNLIGVDFMPDYWESYYEITEGIAGKTRCAGMWNHRYLHQELTLDMQFRHSTWRIGVRHEYLEYGEKSMWFSREQVSAVIGTCFRYRTKGNARLW